jgi:hypothetical protein
MARPVDGARGGWARHRPRYRRCPATALPGYTAPAASRIFSRATPHSTFATIGRRILPSAFVQFRR